MRILKSSIKQLITGGLACLLCATPETLMAFTTQDGVTESKQSSDSETRAQSSPTSEQLPDSPGAVRDQLISQAQQPALETPQSVPPQEPQEAPPQKPVGAAAAEIGNASGIAASKPAGVAMAPAKQRQSRSLLLKLGAIMGAGAAIGAVVALSMGTSSKPPGVR